MQAPSPMVLDPFKEPFNEPLPLLAPFHGHPSAVPPILPISLFVAQRVRIAPGGFDAAAGR